MCLLTRKRSCFNFVCTYQMYIHVSWPIFQVSVFCPSSECCFRSLQIPPCTVHGKQLLLYPSGGITLIFFSLGLIPNRYKLIFVCWFIRHKLYLLLPNLYPNKFNGRLPPPEKNSKHPGKIADSQYRCL